MTTNHISMYIGSTIIRRMQFKKRDNINSFFNYFSDITDTSQGEIKLFSQKKYTGTLWKNRYLLKYAREFPLPFGLVCIIEVLLSDKGDYTQIELFVRINYLYLIFITSITTGLLYSYASDGTPLFMVFLIGVTITTLSIILIKWIYQTTLRHIEVDMSKFEDF